MSASTSARIRSLLAEPRVDDPPRRVWRDYVVVAGVAAAAVIEGVLRDPELAWTPFTAVYLIALALLVPLRRNQPLAAAAAIFGSAAIIDLVALVADVDWRMFNTAIFFLLFPYALFRWGSGREAAVGLAIMLGTASTAFLDETEGVGDAIGGFVILSLCAIVGIVVREQEQLQRRGVEQAQSAEREQLARELHDTVAHHISAIAVQAQAGRAVAKSDPAAAVSALEVIEEAASRTLDEMRTMVGTLRADATPELSPQPGLVELLALAGPLPNGATVSVALHGAVDGVARPVETALFRIARESVTNAVRHARNATAIEICIRIGPDEVHLIVRDDGGVAVAAASGYGLVGMAERADLLGGSLDAGPLPGGGWSVEARFPRDGAGS